MQTRKSWLKNFIRLSLILILLCVMLRWFEHRQIYFPMRAHEAVPGQLARPFEDVTFKTSDGVALNGWFFPAATNSPRRHFVMLICHGNGGNISHRLDLCGLLLQTGVSVFVFDYRGYGRSQGSPGEEGTYRDAQAAYAWLRAKGFAATNIIVFGESLGGGVGSELALRETAGGLILQSTFTSITDIGKELFPWLPVQWINTIKYDTHCKLPRLKIPVLVMHSRHDSLIGFHHGERNFADANEPKLFWELPGDHNESISDPAKFTEGIEKFLGLVEQAGPRDQ